MRRTSILSITTAVLSVATSASAQSPRPSAVDQPLRESARQLQSAGPRGPEIDGYTIAPGLVVSTSGAAEGGYDTNPDRTDGGLGSSYGRANASSRLLAISQNTAAQLQVDGVALVYDERDLDRPDRFYGQIKGDMVRGLAPGLTWGAGGLYAYDGLDAIEDQVLGGFTELAYDTDQLSAYARVRALEVRYLTRVTPPSGVPALLRPLFLTEALDARRAEVITGVMFNKTGALSPYAEAAFADVDYLNGTSGDLVGRDARDRFAKAGVRIGVSPSLRVDLGWRWNERVPDNGAFDSFSSDYLDATFTFAPSAYFALSGAIERTIDEPSSLFGRLADTKSYSLAMRYAATDRIGLGISGRHRIADEIDGQTTFRISEINAEATYDASRWAQYYVGLLYEHVDEETIDQQYERLRIGGGLRIKLGEAVKSPADLFTHPSATRLGTWNIPGGSVVDVSVGYSWLHLPEKRLTTRIGGPFFDTALDTVTDHDGEFRGVRTDVTFDRIASHTFESGRTLAFGIGGFYANYSKTDTSACDFTATSDCALVNIVDFDKDEENNTGPFGVLRATTKRDVHYWGVSPFASFVGHSAPRAVGSLKDDAPAPVPVHVPFYLGLDVRGLHERTKLHAIDISVPDPVDYKEHLDTLYYGGFVGVKRSFAFGDGWSLGLDGRAGVYYAHTSYRGRYEAFVPVGTGVVILEKGRVDLGHDEAAFIGGLGLKLERQLGWMTIGAFGHAEYMSYVPDVRYNNDDKAGGSPFGVVGTQVGTRIDGADAWSATIGVNISIPLSH